MNKTFCLGCFLDYNVMLQLEKMQYVFWLHLFSRLKFSLSIGMIVFWKLVRTQQNWQKRFADCIKGRSHGLNATFLTINIHFEFYCNMSIFWFEAGSCRSFGFHRVVNVTVFHCLIHGIIVREKFLLVTIIDQIALESASISAKWSWTAEPSFLFVISVSVDVEP